MNALKISQACHGSGCDGGHRQVHIGFHCTVDNVRHEPVPNTGQVYQPQLFLGHQQDACIAFRKSCVAAWAMRPNVRFEDTLTIGRTYNRVAIQPVRLHFPVPHTNIHLCHRYAKRKAQLAPGNAQECIQWSRKLIPTQDRQLPQRPVDAQQHVRQFQIDKWSFTIQLTATSTHRSQSERSKFNAASQTTPVRHGSCGPSGPPSVLWLRRTAATRRTGPGRRW